MNTNVQNIKYFVVLKVVMILPHNGTNRHLVYCLNVHKTLNLLSWDEAIGRHRLVFLIDLWWNRYEKVTKSELYEKVTNLSYMKKLQNQSCFTIEIAYKIYPPPPHKVSQIMCSRVVDSPLFEEIVLSTLYSFFANRPLLLNQPKG